MRTEDVKEEEEEEEERKYQSDSRKEGSIFISEWCRGTGKVIGLYVRPN